MLIKTQVHSNISIKLILVLIALVLSCLLMPFSHISAWNSTGAQWYVEEVQPLYWRANTNMDIYDYAAFSNGAWYWNLADTPVEFYYSLNEGSIYCDTINNSQMEWYGYATWYYTDGHLLSVDILLNKYYSDSFPQNKKIVVAGHEFGHAIGLAHETGLVLMNPNIDYIYLYNIYTPQQDDIDGANALYGD
jgi:hypothetical protein